MMHELLQARDRPSGRDGVPTTYSRPRSLVSSIALGKRKMDWDASPQEVLSCQEFQTQSGLYEALLGIMKAFFEANQDLKNPAQYIAFHGSYSIVADGSVSTMRQTTLVSQDLRKIVKLPHR